MKGTSLFARYGYASEQAIENFFGLGLQYKGLLPGRERDVVAIGWAQGLTTGEGFDEPFEGALETYYRARITPWLHLSPHLQYVVNPGSGDVEDALTLGLRVPVTF